MKEFQEAWPLEGGEILGGGVPPFSLKSPQAVGYPPEGQVKMAGKFPMTQVSFFFFDIYVYFLFVVNFVIH